MTTATISANTRRMRGAVNRDTRFANTLASEWLKLATLRSTYITLGLGYLLSVATSAQVDPRRRSSSLEARTSPTGAASFRSACQCRISSRSPAGCI